MAIFVSGGYTGSGCWHQKDLLVECVRVYVYAPVRVRVREFASCTLGCGNRATCRKTERGLETSSLAVLVSPRTQVINVREPRGAGKLHLTVSCVSSSPTKRPYLTQITPRFYLNVVFGKTSPNVLSLDAIPRSWHHATRQRASQASYLCENAIYDSLLTKPSKSISPKG